MPTGPSAYGCEKNCGNVGEERPLSALISPVHHAWAGKHRAFLAPTEFLSGRADCVAVEAVSREPVSAHNSLLTRKNRPSFRVPAKFCLIVRRFCWNSPVSKQGFLTTKQGFFAADQGIRRTVQRPAILNSTRSRASPSYRPW